MRNGQITRLTNDLAPYGGVSAAGDAIVTTRYQTSSSLGLTDASGHNARQVGRDMPSRLGGLSWAGNTRLMYHATMAGRDGVWSPDVAGGAPDLVVPRASSFGASSPSTIGRPIAGLREGRLRTVAC